MLNKRYTHLKELFKIFPIVILPVMKFEVVKFYQLINQILPPPSPY